MSIHIAQMPKIEFKSSGRPSLFAYPPPLEEKKNLTKEKVETAVLSITAKHRRKEAEKKKEEKMDVVSNQECIVIKPTSDPMDRIVCAEKGFGSADQSAVWDFVRLSYISMTVPIRTIPSYS